MTVVYRLSSARFPANSGAGAALYGGRWNPVNIEVIYAAQSRALAALEILVHFDVVPQDFALTEIVIPDSVGILRVEESELPSGWERDPPDSATQELGRQWVDEARYAVLSVPSSIVPADRNFVINPKHPYFANIEFASPVPFKFDPRLK